MIMEKEKLELLLRKIRGQLLGIVRSFALPTGVEAEDVVQETQIALWELAEKGYPIRDAEALAIKIAKNICVAHHRKAHLELQALTHDNYIGGTEATVLTDRADLRQIQQRLYSTLTPTQREYLHLRNEEGLSLDEMAQATGKPKTSIKSTLSQARKQMLDLIKKQL